MKLIRKVALSLIGLSCLLGCGSNSNNGNGIQGVTFVNKGAVVPNPIATTVSVNSNSINYSQTQSGVVIGDWSKRIQFSDYTSVRKVIADNALYEAGDVLLPLGQPTCTGVQGMTIEITKDNKVHAFDIDGGIICDRTQWPAGVRDLINLQDALVAKYR